MGWLFAAALAAASLASAEAVAGADGSAFCADLRSVIAAAQDGRAFASLQRSSGTVPLMGFSDCGVGLMDDSIVCMEDYSDSLARFEMLRRDIKACRPDASEFRDPRLSPTRADGHRVQLSIGRVWVTLHEDGYANLPQRYVSMHVERAPRRWRRKR